MNRINQITKWLMLVSGVLTASMFYGVFAPQLALESMFGVSFDGELEHLVVRSWSALIGLIGGVLVYGFFVVEVRRYSIAIAAISKLIFVSLVFLFGQAYLTTLAAAVVMDVIVATFYLVFCRNDEPASV
ncbi:MAG: hypothetical protein ACRBBW_08845 [Cellvibrionaceae bacterium]